MSDYIANYGIKGQKRGVRRFQNEDGSLTEEGRNRYGVGKEKDWKRLNKDAADDAKEYVKAKAYYGDGAGNRRKHIRNIVNQRKKDPDYAKEFDRQVALQDTEKAVRSADRKRHFEDTKKTASNVLKKAIPTALALASIAATLHATGYDKVIGSFAKRSVNSIGNAFNRHKNNVASWKMNRKLDSMRRR